MANSRGQSQGPSNSAHSISGIHKNASQVDWEDKSQNHDRSSDISQTRFSLNKNQTIQERVDDKVLASQVSKDNYVTMSAVEKTDGIQQPQDIVTKSNSYENIATRFRKSEIQDAPPF